MDKKKDIRIRYNKIIKDLTIFNDLYFNKDNPAISDSEYDSIKKEALTLEKKYPYLRKDKSVSDIVGSPPTNKFKKIKHLSSMLSI